MGEDDLWLTIHYRVPLRSGEVHEGNVQGHHGSTDRPHNPLTCDGQWCNAELLLGHLSFDAKRILENIIEAVGVCQFDARDIEWEIRAEPNNWRPLWEVLYG